MDDGSYKVYCPAHEKLAPAVDNERFAELEVAPDCTQGRDSSDVCMICNGSGRLVLCDGCNRAAHMTCANLKLISAVDDWFCSRCANAGSDVGGDDAKENDLREDSSKTNTVTDIDGTACKKKAKKRGSAASQPSNRKRKSNVLRTMSSNSQQASLSFVPRSESLMTGIQTCDNSPRRGEGNCGSRANWTPLDRPAAATDRSLSQQQVVYKRARRGPTGGATMVVLATGLDAVSQALLAKFKARYKTTVSIVRDFSPRVTHVVVTAYGREDTPTRTVKLCKGIVANLPIVCLKWVSEAVAIAPGLPCPPPGNYLHKYTLSMSQMSPFAGLRFYFGSLRDHAIRKEDLIEIVKTGKGAIMLSEPTVPCILCAPSRTAMSVLSRHNFRASVAWHPTGRTLCQMAVR
jgi:hypothetical protein